MPVSVPTPHSIIPPWYHAIEMNLKDAIRVLAIVTIYVTLAFQSHREFSLITVQIGDLRERITRVETVMTGFSAEVLRLHKRMDDHERR